MQKFPGVFRGRLLRTTRRRAESCCPGMLGTRERGWTGRGRGQGKARMCSWCLFISLRGVMTPDVWRSIQTITWAVYAAVPFRRGYRPTQISNVSSLLSSFLSEYVDYKEGRFVEPAPCFKLRYLRKFPPRRKLNEHRLFLKRCLAS